MRKMIYSIVLTPFILGSCANAEQLEYQIIKEEKERPHPQFEDFSSTFSLSYPLFEGTAVSNAINSDIASVVESIGCLDGGDRNITVDIKHQTPSLLSLYYYASWMCDDMPRESSRSGTLNYNLLTQKRIELNAVINKKSTPSFTKSALDIINADINSPEKNEDIRCKAEEPLDFYFDNKGLTVFYETTINGFMNCKGMYHANYTQLEQHLQPWVTH